MTDLVLYTNPQSRGRIAHWMLEELGIPYETVWLEYGPRMKSGDYLAINPMGKVPAIKHGEVIVTETPAICAYLADVFPEKNLAPAPASPARASYYRWMFFAAGPLEMASTCRAFNWQVPEGRSSTVGFGCYADTMNALEKAVEAGPYICGDQFTAADVYFGSSVGWGMMFGSIEKRPALEAYFHRLSARPSFQSVHRINEEHMKADSA
ncbi:glutathione S-transferase family protein [Noviherbaspirillum aerium]|uniref:glutathione S-transferase family protein n=1 Tax=Noviherbaspirillum aerium TaxID=2588497 RepID=UPI00124DBA9D|nr:glutathione S-transferase family protein [Noviherbaspirillum aerium]